jgi:aspartokinase/homoserine dehydrogenase 1
LKEDTDKRYFLTDILNILKESEKGNILTFIDVTSSRIPMKEFHLEVMKNTSYGIVTSNKNPITMMDYEEFVNLTRNTTRYGCRCSVMAGANAIDEIKDFKDLNDSVQRIEGCFSGTLGYICSELEKDKTFSEIVREAKKQGYTEPHPAEDLSGKDVAKKLLILARTTGIKIEMKDIEIIPFVPKEYLEEDNLERFLIKLKELDDSFVDDNKSEKNFVLRYVASMGFSDTKKPILRVGPRKVSRESPLGMLKGTLNKIVINTDTYTRDEPCIIEAPGAGLQVTAQNIRRDFLQQIKDRIISYP